MSIISQKQQVFGNIAAFRTLTEGLPKQRITSSFPSINNDGNTIAFLSDLIRSLVGYNALQDVIENILTYGLNELELEIKNTLKSELKSIVSCGVDPRLPNFILSNGEGLKIQISKIDFTNLMFVDPKSDVGNLLYNNITNDLIDSTDFNCFLYQTIQNNGSVESWGHQTLGIDIITAQFKARDISLIDKNNTLTIKAHPNIENLTLTDLNNQFIDSISLFNTANVLSSVIDTIFGTISNFNNKTISQLTNQIQVNDVIDRLVSSDVNDVINDSYFQFSNSDILRQQREAKLRNIGIKTISTSTPFQAALSFNSLLSVNNDLKSNNTLSETKSIISRSINQFGNQISSFNNNSSDNQTIKLGFVQDIINNIIKTIVNSVLSPKVILIFLINSKIIYGNDVDYIDSIDFLRKNKNLIKNITNKISDLIVRNLLKIALKEIATLVAAGIAKQQIDKIQSNTQQLLSLVGVPQDILRQIRGLS